MPENPKQGGSAKAQETKAQDTKATETETTLPTLPKFEVEFGDENNRTIVINCLKLRLRGSFSVAKLHARGQGGRDVGSAMVAMPDIPGLRMIIDPAQGQAFVYDPLENQPEKIKAINNASARARSIRSDVTFVPSQKISLNGDELKTLLLEVCSKVEGGSAELVRGELPSRADIESLRGRKLYDPWASGRKPKYTDEVDAWVQRIDEKN